MFHYHHKPVAEAACFVFDAACDNWINLLPNISKESARTKMSENREQFVGGIGDKDAQQRRACLAARCFAGDVIYGKKAAVCPKQRRGPFKTVRNVGT